MLAGKNAIVYLREKTTEVTPDRCCPQGGVRPSLSWCFVANDLLDDLRREDFHVYVDVDDIAIVAGGRFLTTLRDWLEHYLKIAYR
jgi:hypothetical protein